MLELNLIKINTLIHMVLDAYKSGACESREVGWGIRVRDIASSGLDLFRQQKKKVKNNLWIYHFYIIC